jgi:hypothetical protein
MLKQTMLTSTEETKGRGRISTDCFEKFVENETWVAFISIMSLEKMRKNVMETRSLEIKGFQNYFCSSLHNSSIDTILFVSIFFSLVIFVFLGILTVIIVCYLHRRRQRQKELVSESTSLMSSYFSTDYYSVNSTECEGKTPFILHSGIFEKKDDGTINERDWDSHVLNQSPAWTSNYIPQTLDGDELQQSELTPSTE